MNTKIVRDTIDKLLNGHYLTCDHCEIGVMGIGSNPDGDSAFVCNHCKFWIEYDVLLDSISVDIDIEIEKSPADARSKDESRSDESADGVGGLSAEEISQMLDEAMESTHDYLALSKRVEAVCEILSKQKGRFTLGSSGGCS